MEPGEAAASGFSPKRKNQEVLREAALYSCPASSVSPVVVAAAWDIVGVRLGEKLEVGVRVKEAKGEMVEVGLPPAAPAEELGVAVEDLVRVRLGEVPKVEDRVALLDGEGELVGARLGVEERVGMTRLPYTANRG